jgi:hypothetical protein
MDTLTEHQAFLAMYAFLEAEYETTQSDDIGALLGSLSLLGDGLPADPAMLDHWKAAVSAARAGEVDAALRLGGTK